MKITLRYFLVLGAIIVTSVAPLRARHIIGGEITYECLGGGLYDFTLQIYRDCNCTMCADFDPLAFIAVYRCGNGVNCGSLDQNDFFRRIDAPLLERAQVAAPDYPCLIPPDVCVEEGLYQFQLQLPPSNESYHISYQRCCRNVTINNIFDPENSGATYTVEITPEAQAACNNSPVFNQFPPTVICAGAPLNFDHSATDPDGDSLAYSFCSPLLGGGPILEAGGYETCEGAHPNPACPPPYDFVTFIPPNFSAGQPMAGNPVVSINPITGLITGTPALQGQFVVGVCVREYRDGELLGVVRRDFQFNVASCDPTVVADVREDEILNDQEFVINSCGENTVTFVNESFQEQFIEQFFWSFPEGEPGSPTEWSPSVTFPDTGQYRGVLILNPDTACGDTAEIRVNVFPEIEADFSFAYDTCIAGPVTFTDLSFSGSAFLTDWAWQFGEGGAAEVPDPVYVYAEPGVYDVTLTVRDTNQCEDDITRPLSYFPVPELLLVAPSTFDGCVPAEIFFDNLSTPINDQYTISWDFGDGGTDTTISPVYTYEAPGLYTVSLEVVSPLGCETDTIFPNWIRVEPSPTAGFRFEPVRPTNLDPEVTFTDESADAVQWLYDFGTGAVSLQPDPVYVFPDTGQFAVTQVVTHPSGCTDTLVRLIDVIPEVRYFLPNAFTPNGDGRNDTFRGTGFMLGATAFRMTIWNRWGELIFETGDPEEAWNGRKFNSGDEAPPGVYVVLVSFRGPRGEPWELKGLVTLLQ